MTRILLAIAVVLALLKGFALPEMLAQALGISPELLGAIIVGTILTPVVREWFE